MSAAAGSWPRAGNANIPSISVPTTTLIDVRIIVVPSPDEVECAKNNLHAASPAATRSWHCRSRILAILMAGSHGGLDLPADHRLGLEDLLPLESGLDVRLPRARLPRLIFGLIMFCHKP